jgi:hypothetical protein
MLLPISQSRSKDIVGGKGAHLNQLWSWGFSIPVTYCLPVSVFETFLSSINIDLSQNNKEIKTILESASIDKELCSIIRETLSKHGQIKWAVRSSEVSEDGKSLSYAGQYSSLLNIELDDIPKAIIHCWASSFNEHQEKYHHKNIPAKMGLIIQEMIIPKISGVLFTINPINGSPIELNIESVPGIGDNLMNGSLMPDRYRVARPKEWPRPLHRLVNRLKFKEIERVERSETTLSHKNLKTLASLALQIEKFAGCPQDIEWALNQDEEFIFLQTRAITTGNRNDKGIVWTRQFLGERWSEPVTPLGWSHMGNLIKYFIEYPDTAAKFWNSEPSLQLFDGAPYLNATVFRHLLFKPWLSSPCPNFFLEMLPADEGDFYRSTPSFSPNIKVYQSIIRTTFLEKRWKRFRWNPINNWKVWDTFVPELQTFIEQHKEPPRTIFEAQQRSVLCEEIARQYLGIHVPSYIFANLWWQLAKYMLDHSNQSHLIQTVLRSKMVTPTQRCNQALWELENNVRSMDEFLQEYGHRSTSSYALFSLRYCESKKLVFKLAKNFSKSKEPSIAHKECLYKLHSATNDLSGRLQYVVQMTQRYLFLREEQRFHFDHLLWCWKKTYLWIENHLDMQIRYLTKEELRNFLQGQLTEVDASLIIEKRSSEWNLHQEKWNSDEGLPAFIREGKPLLGKFSKIRKGTPVSSGTTFGPVKRISKLSEGVLLQEGDILVIQQGDPS